VGRRRGTGIIFGKKKGHSVSGKRATPAGGRQMLRGKIANVVKRKRKDAKSTPWSPKRN